MANCVAEIALEQIDIANAIMHTIVTGPSNTQADNITLT
jgi:hypothetical protein